MKFTFVEKLLLAKRSKVRNYLSIHPHIGLNVLARYAESYCDALRAIQRQAARTDSLPTQRWSTSSCLMTLRTDLDKYESAIAETQVFAVENGSSLSSSPKMVTISASKSSRAGQITASPRGVNLTSIRVMNKLCQICLSREPDSRLMLPPDICLALLAAPNTIFTLHKES